MKKEGKPKIHSTTEKESGLQQVLGRWIQAISRFYILHSKLAAVISKRNSLNSILERMEHPTEELQEIQREMTEELRLLLTDKDAETPQHLAVHTKRIELLNMRVEEILRLDSNSPIK